ncbi:hypothetical protein T190_05580 [Sinorhizobium meliloti CCBAU 01290]|nr:hypothetical protein T190_05580 [Sinorhizobium meliloti CCBAU 01290]
MTKMLTDSFVQGAFQRLMDVATGMQEAGPSAAAVRLQLDANSASLRDVAFSVIDSEANVSSDERFVEIAQAAVSNILLDCVGSDYKIFAHKPLSQLNADFSAASLDTAATDYLAGLMRNMIFREVRKVEPAIAQGLYSAIDDISGVWIERAAAMAGGGSVIQKVGENLRTLAGVTLKENHG